MICREMKRGAFIKHLRVEDLRLQTSLFEVKDLCSPHASIFHDSPELCIGVGAFLLIGGGAKSFSEALTIGPSQG